MDGLKIDRSNDWKSVLVVHFRRPFLLVLFIQGPESFYQSGIQTLDQNFDSRVSRIDSRCGVNAWMALCRMSFFDILLFCLEFWIFWRNLRFQLLTWSHKVNAILQHIIAYYSTVTSCKLYIYYHQSRETSHWNLKSVSPHKLHINSQ